MTNITKLLLVLVYSTCFYLSTVVGVLLRTKGLGPKCQFTVNPKKQGKSNESPHPPLTLSLEHQHENQL